MACYHGLCISQCRLPSGFDDDVRFYFRNFHAAVLLELRITRGLLKHNLTVAVLPTFFYLAGAFIQSGSVDFLAIFKTACFSLSFAYVFDIANQVVGIDEDRINKPSRPIPAGILSVQGAYIRWAISWALFPLILSLLTSNHHPLIGLTAALYWEVLVVAFYVIPLGHISLTGRFLFTSLGSVVHISMVSTFLGQISLSPAIPLWFLLTIHIQDLHDMEGDSKRGRRTLPLLFKEYHHALRCVYGMVLVLFSLYFALNGSSVSSLHIFSLSLLQLLLALVIAVRVILCQSLASDNFTYRYLYALLYGLLMMQSGAVLMMVQ